MTRRRLFMAALLAATTGTPPVWACSTCKCGDYTITLFGSEQPFEGRLRLAIDALQRGERQGRPGVDALETDEQRLNLGLSYSLSPAWTVAAQLPYVRKTLTTASLAREEAEGWGDLDLIGRWALHTAYSGPVLRSQSGLRLGVRLPTSEQVRAGDGRLLSIDVQPDAGATAPNLGVFHAWYGYPWFATVTATYFAFGEARQGFSPGDAAVISAKGQYALTPALALNLSLDARYAGTNRFDGERDPNSGGTLVMTQVGGALRLGDDWLLHAAVQIPTVDALRGEQEEDAVFRLGLALDL